MSIWRTLRAVLALPGVVTLAIPALIVARSGSVRVGWGLPHPWRLIPIAAGATAIGGGLLLVGATVRQFHRQGKGTLAPWDPPRHLVVEGVYRRVRNPMISGVICVLLGEGLLLGSRPLLAWCLAVGLLNAVYIPLVEEPGLLRRFGDEYRIYRQNVPRWIPRRRPWQPPWE